MADMVLLLILRKNMFFEAYDSFLIERQIYLLVGGAKWKDRLSVKLSPLFQPPFLQPWYLPVVLETFELFKKPMMFMIFSDVDLLITIESLFC